MKLKISTTTGKHYYFQTQSANLLEKNQRAKLGNIFQFSNTKEVQFSREENITL